MEELLPRLTGAERQEFLLKLVRREPHVDRQLINRLKELAGEHSAPPPASDQERRHFSQLVALSKEMEVKRKQKEQEVAKKKRIKESEDLAPKAEQTWERVLYSIDRKQAYAYNQAIQLLRNLRDLAKHQGQLPVFRQRFERLKSDYRNRSAIFLSTGVAASTLSVLLR